MNDHFSPETRAWLDKKYAEEAQRFGPMLDAALLEAENLRRSKGHKARERTSSLVDMAYGSLHPSQATE
jgi:hypothetical protein